MKQDILTNIANSNKGRPDAYFDTLVYRNMELVNATDAVAKKIIDTANSCHHRDRFFPKLIDALGLEVGLEIGTDKGGFANNLLTRSSLKVLHCVDPWIDDFGSDHRPGFFDAKGQNRMEEARTLLSKFMDQGRCFLHRGFSGEIAQGWEIPLDFIYVDGDHSLEGVYTDLYSWTEKVKEGGIIAGHDYKDGPKSGMQDYFGGQLPFRVKTVVDNFCQQYGFKLHTVGGRIISWWFAKT